MAADESAKAAIEALRARIDRADEATLDLLLREARSFNGWLDTPVTKDQLHAIYDLMKWGPTSGNGLPARLLFLTSSEAKERLRPALMPGNVDKTLSAPVVCVVAHDLAFHAQMHKTFPHDSGLAKLFAGNAALAEMTAFRNGTLQGAYLILAARAVGLDAGPMSGFDNAKVDAEFLAGTSLRSNFLCNIGHGDPDTIFARSPRLDFDDACQIL